MEQTVELRDLWKNAANLLSLDAENPEYDRAIVELVADCSGISQENRHSVYVGLWAMTGRRDRALAPYPFGTNAPCMDHGIRLCRVCVGQPS